MISIKIEEEKELEKWFKDIVDDILSKEYSNINKAIREDFGLDNKIEDLVLSKYSKLSEVKSAIEMEKHKFLIDEKKKPTSKNLRAPWKEIYDAYNKFTSDKNNIKLISKMGITVCPYCNREYINNRKSGASAQLDHFFPRSIYPIFAVSLYNLIPACYACNHLKSNREISISPYDDNANFDDLLKFSYIPKSMSFLEKTNEIDIDLRLFEDGAKDLVKNVRELQIDKSYEIHTDYVQEIIKKAIIYNESKIREIFFDFPGLFSGKEEILRIIFGNYLSNEELGKRPLAKLTKDICEELGIDLR